MVGFPTATMPFISHFPGPWRKTCLNSTMKRIEQQRYLGLCQTSMMEIFRKTFKCSKYNR